MKTKYIALVIGIFLSFGLTHIANAQLRTDSDPITTRVGNPPTSSDPISGNIPPIEGDPFQAVQNTFGVSISKSFPEIYAIWAWELLWRVSNTSFDERVRNTQISRNDEGSSMKGCEPRKIEMKGTYGNNRQLFDVVFTHEMGHIIRSCSDPNFADEHNIARREGQLTSYSQTLCLWDTPTPWNYESENYAEMIAYYLNPTAPAQTACTPGPNPFDNGAHPLQKDVARQILMTQPQ
ncbi:MAG TPA: hypothetical protein PLD54_00300 [Candidatus Levybacteria bacterium]|nr:hypothetical protein [Candidatus Levybacteria bacterium]